MANHVKDNQHLITRSFRSYLIPSILAILGGNISFMVDHIIAGKQLGGDALAAMSLTGPLFFLLTTIGTLFCVGSSTIASVSLGKEDKQTANQLFTLAILSVLLFGGLVSVVGSVFLEPIARFLSGGSELHPLVLDYCRGMILGAFCIIAVYLPLNFFRIEARGHLGMAMFLIMAVLNISLDLFFTIVLELGMLGLALATVLSSLIAVVAVAPFLFIKGGSYRLVPIAHPLRLIKNTITIGSPPALNNFYSVVRASFLNMIILTVGGPVAVAGFAFANSVNTLAQAIVSGISQTVSPLVGIFFGEHDVVSIRKVVGLAMRVGVSAMLGFGVVIAVSSKQICVLFGLTTAAQQAAAVPALILCAVSLPLVMVDQILCYHYMTIGKTRLANLLTLCRGLLFILAAAGILSQIVGIIGIWIAFTVSEACTLLVISIEARRIRLKNRELKGLLLLDGRDVDEGGYLSCSVATNTESVMEGSRRVSDFCESRNLAPKVCLVISLATEEILLLMLKHVFADKTDDTIDVKIFVRDNATVLRLRCGGRKFNPLAYYKAALERTDKAADADFDESMGLSLISKMAKQVDYTTNLGLNNIIIRLEG